MKAGAADYLNKSQLAVDTLDRAVRHALALHEEERHRRLAEAALRANEERFRALVENSSDALLLIDGVGRLTYVAASTGRHLGWDTESMIGRSLLDVLHPDDREVAAMRIGEALRHPSEPVTQEVRLRHADGEWRVMEAIAVNRLTDASVGAIVINARDLTDRRRLEDALRQSQKMEAVGQLAGGVAHDFNNLLTAILGYCNLILEQLPQDHRLRADLDEIRTAGERAASVTRQLLAFGRRQMLQPQVVDVNELVGQLEKLLKRLTGDELELSIRLGDNVSAVRVDPSSIEQVIINLAVNAKDAMPQGGRLAIETANVEIDDTAENRLSHEAPPPGMYVRLSVSDNGAGMDEATRTHIFEPFFTTKAMGRGLALGLGLATVYGIVKQNGGYIFVASEIGQGSTFSVYLRPVQMPAARPEAPTERAWETVLLVEDDDAVRALGREVLQREGYIVLEAKHAADALRIGERHTDEIHALIAGQTIGHMTGRELGDRLSEKRPRVKRILLLKPFNADALIAELHDVLAGTSPRLT